MFPEKGFFTVNVKKTSKSEDFIEV